MDSFKNIIGCLEIRFHSYLLNLYDLHSRLEYLHIIEGSEECAGQDLHFFKDLSWLDFKDVNWVHFKDPICVHRAPPRLNIFWHHQFSASLLMYLIKSLFRKISIKSQFSITLFAKKISRRAFKERGFRITKKRYTFFEKR